VVTKGQLMSFKLTFHVRWADLDANAHMRHSAYNDYAAHVRVSMFDKYHYPFSKLIKLGIGPVLFREETVFKKELHLHQEFHVDCAVSTMRRNGKIWQMRHQFFDTDNQLLAIITVDGAWLDLKDRKVIEPPKNLLSALDDLPRTDDFKWLD